MTPDERDAIVRRAYDAHPVLMQAAVSMAESSMIAEESDSVFVDSTVDFLIGAIGEITSVAGMRNDAPFTIHVFNRAMGVIFALDDDNE